MRRDGGGDHDPAVFRGNSPSAEHMTVSATLPDTSAGLLYPGGADHGKRNRTCGCSCSGFFVLMIRRENGRAAAGYEALTGAVFPL